MDAQIDAGSAREATWGVFDLGRTGFTWDGWAGLPRRPRCLQTSLKSPSDNQSTTSPERRTAEGGRARDRGGARPHPQRTRPGRIRLGRSGCYFVHPRGLSIFLPSSRLRLPAPRVAALQVSRSSVGVHFTCRHRFVCAGVPAPRATGAYSVDLRAHLRTADMITCALAAGPGPPEATWFIFAK